MTPGANFGTRTVTLVPAPGAVSTTRPYSSPYVVRSRASTFPSPIESMLTSPASARRTFSGSSPAPSSSTSMMHSWPRSCAWMVMVPMPSAASSPCRTAFSTSGWMHRNGTATGSTSGAMLSFTDNRSPNRACSRSR